MNEPTGIKSTNSTHGSTQNVAVTRKNRIIIYGGAYSKGDNNTFRDAANNLKRMYEAKYKNQYNYFTKEIKVKKDLIDLINRQPANSIKSLDIFTHGGEDSLYMVSVRQGDSNSSMNKYWWWRYFFNNQTFKSSDLKSLNHTGFVINSKIEIRGCKTANNPKGEDNLASTWSRVLATSGKNKSVVIGHTTNASPLINGSSTKANEQSYMWLQRAVYKGGRLILLTEQKGFLDEEALTK